MNQFSTPTYMRPLRAVPEALTLETHVEVDEKMGLIPYPSTPPIPKRNAVV